MFEQVFAASFHGERGKDRGGGKQREDDAEGRPRLWTATEQRVHPLGTSPPVAAGTAAGLSPARCRVSAARA